MTARMELSSLALPENQTSAVATESPKFRTKQSVMYTYCISIDSEILGLYTECGADATPTINLLVGGLGVLFIPATNLLVRVLSR